MSVSKRRIVVQIKGVATEGGYPRLSDFLQQLEAVKTALKHTERLLLGDGERSVYYRIVELKMSSPATVTLEEQPLSTADGPGRLPRIPIGERLVSTLSQIERRGHLPHVKDLAALEAYRGVGSLLHRRQVEAVTLKSANRIVTIGEEFNRNIDKIIGPDETIEGSISGLLLAVNLHNTTRFEIYPAIGPAKVVCDFPASLKPDVIRGLDHNVKVFGQLRYKHWAPHPHAITAGGIDIFPADDELPSIFDLRGLMRQNGDGESKPNDVDDQA